MLRNNDFTPVKFLDYLHHQKYYKPIGIDLSGKEMRVFLNKLILQEN